MDKRLNLRHSKQMSSELSAAGATLGYPYGSFIRLLLLTGQGEGEVARMRREQVSERIWQIPDAKRGTPRRITLL